MRSLVTIPLVLILCGSACAADRTGEARASAIAPFLDEQAQGVVFFDLSRFDTAVFFRSVARLNKGEAKLLAAQGENVSREVNRLTRAGVKDLFLILGLADIPNHPPLVVVPIPRDADVKKMTEALQGGLFAGQQVQRRGEALVVGDKKTLERLKDLKAEPRPGLAQALAVIGDGVAGGVFLPTTVLRRAVMELLPTLPLALGGGPSRLIVEGVEWIAVRFDVTPKGFDVPPEVAVQFVLKSTDGNTARALRTRMTKLLEVMGKNREVNELIPGFARVAEGLVSRVEEDRLTLAVDEKTLVALAVPLAQNARQAATQEQSINNLKQIGIGFHNYHDQHRSFPAHASFDKKNKPLLSWRVHLLPFLDQEKLYKEFRLDEPWDSDHNKKLIKKMPKLFASPLAGAKLAREGRTTYMVPVGPDTVFPGQKSAKIADISDGTSNTILAVEVEDARAVVWTKPADLEIDPKKPAKGLRNDGGKGFPALLADGFSRLVPLKIEEDTLRALFTRAGNEVIKLP